MDILKRQRKMIIAIGVALIALSFILVFYRVDQNVLLEEVSLWKDDEQVLVLEVVGTPALRQRGLSGRETLATTTGMLFVFERPDRHGIWMKDMLISIDIIWLSDKFEVINLKTDVNPDTYPTVFTPTSPAWYVLETNAGFVEQFEVKIGEILGIRKTTFEK